MNRSVSAVSRAIGDGRLEFADSGRRMIFRPGLEVRFRQKTRPRIDALQRKTQNRQIAVTAAPTIARDYWQRLSDKLSFGWMVPLPIGQRHQMRIAYDYLSGQLMSCGVRLKLRVWRPSSRS